MFTINTCGSSFDAAFFVYDKTVPIKWEIPSSIPISSEDWNTQYFQEACPHSKGAQLLRLEWQAPARVQCWTLVLHSPPFFLARTQGALQPDPPLSGPFSLEFKCYEGGELAPGPSPSPPQPEPSPPPSPPSLPPVVECPEGCKPEKPSTRELLFASHPCPQGCVPL